VKVSIFYGYLFFELHNKINEFFEVKVSLHILFMFSDYKKKFSEFIIFNLLFKNTLEIKNRNILSNIYRVLIKI